MKTEDSPAGRKCLYGGDERLVILILCIFIASLIRVIHPDTVHFNWTGSEFVGFINVENISDTNVLYKVRMDYKFIEL